MQTYALLGILRGIVHYKAGIVHAAPLIPVRTVRNEANARELLDSLLHGPVYLFYVIIGGGRIYRAEHLGIVHHVAGIEERYAVFKPLLAVLRAEIFRTVLFRDI